jgi:hypothetical protein
MYQKIPPESIYSEHFSDVLFMYLTVKIPTEGAVGECNV